jgi:hypothetical protein
MSLSRREAILAAFAARLSASREPARTDMGEALGTYMDDQGESGTLDPYDFERHVITVRVESVHGITTIVGVGIESRATAANRLLASLHATANGTDRTLGGLCDDILYTGGGTLLLEDPTKHVGAYASFEITYSIPVGNPYLSPSPSFSPSLSPSVSPSVSPSIP